VDPETTEESADELSVTIRRDSSRSIVAITGELDLTTIEPLRAKLREALAEGVDTVELDLSGVEFIDSVNLALLLAFQVNGAKEGLTFRVVAASDEFARVVTLSGLADSLLPPPAPTE
jgi:anti-anti-sigma factor